MKRKHDLKISNNKQPSSHQLQVNKMSLENSKRPNESSEVNGNGTLGQRKRIRTSKDGERPQKRRLSSSSDGQQLKIQHISTSASRPPIIPLAPSQRLDLLKRRQRWRQTNFYNSRNHLAGSGYSSSRSTREPSVETGTLVSINSKASQSNYVEVSTQTDSIPSLKSRTIQRAKPSQVDSKTASGVFSGEILYDSDDLNEGKNKSPVKFPDSKSSHNRAVPVSSGTLNALVNDKKKITQVEKPKQIVEEPVKQKEPVEPPVKEASVGPSAGFNFLNSKPKKIEELGDTEQESKEKEPVPSFSFGAPKDTSKDSPAANKTFSFGAKISDIKETSTPAFSFSSKVEDKEKPKPTFSFGSKPESQKAPTSTLFGSKPEASNSEETKGAAKPTFSFGNNSSEAPSLFPKDKKQDEAKPALSFGSTSTTINPAFNFAPKKVESTEKEQSKQKTPALSFGGALSSTAAPVPLFGGKKLDDNSSKPSFNFGAKATENTKEQTSSLFENKPAQSNAKPSFAFGEKPKEASEKPVFSFGTNADPKNEVSKPSFSIGAPANGFLGTEKKDDKPATEGEPENKKPAFNFAPAASSSKPTINFGSSTSVEASKPSLGSFFKPSGFNFGAPSTTETKEEPAPKKTAFSLGESSKPLFGSSSTPTTEKPAFSFSPAPPAPATQSTTSTAQENKPTFGFGNSTAAAPSKPLGFNFGQTTKPELNPKNSGPTATTNSISAFNFNAGGSTPAPASVFGQPPAAQASSTPFNFGGAAKPPFQGDAQQSTAFASGSTPFGNNSPAVNPSFATGNNVSFNFGASNGASSTPAAIFGQPQQPAFGSNQPQQPSTGFNFGGAQPPAFGGASTPFGGASSQFGSPAVGTPGTPSQQQSRVPGRKIAQMRTRRR